MAIEKDEPRAMNNLANMYYMGQGVKQNYLEAIRFYQMAIDKGNPSAMYNLADMYFDGIGVKQSYKKASRLYQMAETFF